MGTVPLRFLTVNRGLVFNGFSGYGYCYGYGFENRKQYGSLKMNE